MKLTQLALIGSTFLLAQMGVRASAAVRYQLTITNGGQMPISPPAVYVKNGEASHAQVGQVPTRGFVEVCETGALTLRVGELRADSAVTYVTQANGPIMPGQSQMFNVEVHNPRTQSVHFETMYGKTKDICGLGSIGSHSLYALKQHVTTEFVGKDNVVASGAFAAPMVPASYSETNLCGNAEDAITCLRELSVPVNSTGKIHFFAPYSPSVIQFLESKYGAADVQSLIFPASGAIQFQLKLQH